MSFSYQQGVPLEELSVNNVYNRYISGTARLLKVKGDFVEYIWIGNYISLECVWGWITLPYIGAQRRRREWNNCCPAGDIIILCIHGRLLLFAYPFSEFRHKHCCTSSLKWTRLRSLFAVMFGLDVCWGKGIQHRQQMQRTERLTHLRIPDGRFWRCSIIEMVCRSLSKLKQSLIWRVLWYIGYVWLTRRRTSRVFVHLV